MFVRSNGKIRLTDAAYATWKYLVMCVFPGLALFCFLCAVWVDRVYFSVLGVIFSVAAVLMGLMLRISEIRMMKDIAAYDGLVSVIPATEDRVKQIIFRLYKGPEALDDATTITLKVDHGALSIEEFDDDVEEDTEEEPRK